MTNEQTFATDAMGTDAIARILRDCDRNIDKATAEIMRRDAWLIRHAVRRGVEAVREADDEATRQEIIADVLAGTL